MDIHYTNIFTKNAVSQARVIANMGGARSSKSHSLAQIFIKHLLTQKNKKLGITRKTMPSLRRTTYEDFMRLLRAYDIYALGKHSKSECYFEYNGNRVTFFGLDDPDKVKSWEFNYLWMEEADQFTWDDYLTLSTRMSGALDGAIDTATGKPYLNQIYLSFNPTNVMGWIPKRLMIQDGVEVIKSSWLDNPFLNAAYVRENLLGLKKQDINSYRAYCLGEWAQRENLIYSNYEWVDSLPANPDETIFGMDFGFNNPSVLVRIDIKDKVCYIDEVLYQEGLTNTALINQMNLLVPQNLKRRPFYADAAEPDRIEEIRRAGFGCIAAEKSVLDGIDTVKSCKLRFTKRSEHIQREIENYKWRVDNENRPIDDPVKYLDHAMDAMRYALRTHIGKRKPQPHWERL